MSESQSLEIVRRAFDAFAHRDVEGMLPLFDADAEFHAPTAERANRSGPYRGEDGLRQYFSDVERVWEELRVIPQDFREIGDQVLVMGRVYARGHGGYIVDSPAQWVFRLLGDKVVFVRVFEDRDEALKAVGLEGEKAH